MRYIFYLLLFTILNLIIGCQIDVFDLSCRKISNFNYSLCRDQDGADIFWLESGGQLTNGGGVLGGTIQEISWNDKIIVASRHATSRSDPDGLMILDTSNNHIKGPINKEIFIQQYPSMKFISASQAWEKLK